LRICNVAVLASAAASNSRPHLSMNSIPVRVAPPTPLTTLGWLAGAFGEFRV